MASRIGRRIRKFREENGMTQVELGNEAGYASDTISKWELGKFSPSEEALRNLAEALGVSISNLDRRHKSDKEDPSVPRSRRKVGNSPTTIYQRLLEALGIERTPSDPRYQHTADEVMEAVRLWLEHGGHEVWGSQAKAADKLGISKTTLNGWIGGVLGRVDNPPPYVEEARRRLLEGE